MCRIPCQVGGVTLRFHLATSLQCSRHGVAAMRDAECGYGDDVADEVGGHARPIAKRPIVAVLVVQRCQCALCLSMVFSGYLRHGDGEVTENPWRGLLCFAHRGFRLAAKCRENRELITG